MRYRQRPFIFSLWCGPYENSFRGVNFFGRLNQSSQFVKDNVSNWIAVAAFWGEQRWIQEKQFGMFGQRQIKNTSFDISSNIRWISERHLRSYVSIVGIRTAPAPLACNFSTIHLPRNPAPPVTTNRRRVFRGWWFNRATTKVISSLLTSHRSAPFRKVLPD